LAAAQAGIDEASKVGEAGASAEWTTRSMSDVEGNSEEYDEVDRMSKLKASLGKPPKSWLAAAQAGIDEASQIGEAGASAERTVRSTSDGEDNSEEPDEVDRMSSTIGDRYKGSDEAIRVKSPEVEKSSSGRVTAEAKSSSNNVSEGASEEQLADNKVLSFDEALPEEEEGSYEADEKPKKGRPRRRIQTLRKFSDFVMNSTKNRQIRGKLKLGSPTNWSDVSPETTRLIDYGDVA